MQILRTCMCKIHLILVLIMQMVLTMQIVLEMQILLMDGMLMHYVETGMQVEVMEILDIKSSVMDG